MAGWCKPTGRRGQAHCLSSSPSGNLLGGWRVGEPQGWILATSSGIPSAFRSAQSSSGKPAAIAAVSRDDCEMVERMIGRLADSW